MISSDDGSPALGPREEFERLARGLVAVRPVLRVELAVVQRFRLRGMLHLGYPRVPADVSIFTPIRALLGVLHPRIVSIRFVRPPPRSAVGCFHRCRKAAGAIVIVPVPALQILVWE